MNNLGATEAAQIREAAAALASLDIANTSAPREVLLDLAHALTDLHEPIRVLLMAEADHHDDADFTAEMLGALDGLVAAAGGIKHAADNI